MRTSAFTVLFALVATTQAIQIQSNVHKPLKTRAMAQKRNQNKLAATKSESDDDLDDDEWDQIHYAIEDAEDILEHEGPEELMNVMLDIAEHEADYEESLEEHEWNTAAEEDEA